MNFSNLVRWAIAFLVVALVAAVLGFGGFAGAQSGLARILFWIAIILAIVSFLANSMRRT